MKAPRKVLFLDFDGVLHPGICVPSRYFERMPALASALDGADVGIVVSSSWRFHHPWQAIAAFFPPALRPKLLGHSGPPLPGRHSRWQEINAYRQLHDIRDWRALDDSAFEFPPQCEELILCNGAVGLTEREVALLRNWLAT